MSISPDDQSHGCNHASPYAGRWVARIRDQIIGQGGTPSQALSSARTSRPKEQPLLSFIPFTMTLTYPPILFRLQEIFAKENGIYLVGGVIRDALHGKASHDLDLVCIHDVKQFARKAANQLGASFFTMDPARDVHRVIYHPDGADPVVIDFTGCRGGSLDEDLHARDFTINAVAVDLQDPYKTIDPTGGIQDLRDRHLRACSPYAFEQDPLRILRGIRFAAGLQLRMDPSTRGWMKQSVNMLRESSIERKRDEFLKILELSQASTALHAFDWLGALDALVPGFGEYRKTAGKTEWENLLGWIQSIHHLVELLNRENPAQSADDYKSGMVCMKLGRFDMQIKQWFGSTVEPGFTRVAYISLAAILASMCGLKSTKQLAKIAEDLKFSRDGVRYFIQFAASLDAFSALPNNADEISPLHIFHFFKGRNMAAVDAVLAMIAQATPGTSVDMSVQSFEQLLNKCAALLDAWWNHQDEWVSPHLLI